MNDSDGMLSNEDIWKKDIRHISSLITLALPNNLYEVKILNE